MNTMLQIATLFLAQLGFGSAIILPFFPNKVTGLSFVRFYYGFISIFLALFLVCLVRLEQFHVNYLLLSALGFWLFALCFLKKEFGSNENRLMGIFAFVSLAMMFIYPQKHLFHGVSLINYLIPFSLLLSSTVFLSLHMMNMIFGHWYLVNRSLPIIHLIKSCRFLIFFTYFRIATVIASTFLAKSTLSADQFDRLIDILGHGIFFWARILTGLGIPLLVAHLSYASAKIHSNQSATGILYAGTIFVLMGELMALYLFSVTGIIF